MANSVESRDWSFLPPDICGKIKSYFIELHDVNKFRGVCKEWRKSFCPEDEFGSEWLFQKDDDKSILRLYHPLAYMNNPYCIYIPLDVNNASIHGCKDGWLLMSLDLNNMFFYNPLSKSTIPLPELPSYEGDFSGFACTSAPTLEECMVLVTTQDSYDDCIEEMFTICKGESVWRRKSITGLKPCHRNSVHHKDKFYFVSCIGHLGVFDPKTQTWMVYGEDEKSIDYKLLDEGYLLDVDGDLTSVFMSKYLIKTVVLRWDECKLKWQEVEDVGEYTLFLSYKASFAKKDMRSYMRNKIYLPIYYKGYGVFYCLNQKSYHTSQHDIPRWSSVTELCKSCWFEPAQLHCSSKLMKWIPSQHLMS